MGRGFAIQLCPGEDIGWFCWMLIGFFVLFVSESVEWDCAGVYVGVVVWENVEKVRKSL